MNSGKLAKYCCHGTLTRHVWNSGSPAPAAGGDEFDLRVTELMMSGYKALEHEQYEEALEYLEQARKLDKKEPVVLRTLYGEVLFELGRYEEVVDLLKGEVRKDRETDIDILRLLAYSYEELEENDKAISRFKDVLEAGSRMTSGTAAGCWSCSRKRSATRKLIVYLQAAAGPPQAELPGGPVPPGRALPADRRQESRPATT